MTPTAAITVEGGPGMLEGKHDLAASPFSTTRSRARRQRQGALSVLDGVADDELACRLRRRRARNGRLSRQAASPMRGVVPADITRAAEQAAGMTRVSLGPRRRRRAQQELALFHENAGR
ncbi:MAG: hypothetical protein R3D02_11870 [Hyphomicrobiales bacterium]